VQRARKFSVGKQVGTVSFLLSHEKIALNCQ